MIKLHGCRVFFFFLLCIINLNACSFLKNQVVTDAAPPVVVEEATENSRGFSNVSELEKIIAENNPLMVDSIADERGEKVPLHIPLEINQKVADWVDYFTVRDRERTIRFLERGMPLKSKIEQILKDNEVPPELFYLAMIESGFVLHAKSHASAVGVWQFMKGTGKNYGLTVNSSIDERRNWIKATEAAAAYLKDLNNVFGSWYLALAAYNAGEHRIVRSIMRGKTRDFWALAEAGMLPKETLDYVPKFLAAQIVGKNLDKYNLRIQPEQSDLWEEYASTAVPSGVSLKQIAKVADISYEALKKWNADLIKDHTPYSRSGSVEIYVSKAAIAKIEEAKDEIGKIKRIKLRPERNTVLASSGGNNGSYSYHVVQQGESLYTISRQLGISMRTLMKINGIRKSRIHPGQRLRYYKSLSPPVTQKNKKKRTLSSVKRHG